MLRPGGATSVASDLALIRPLPCLALPDAVARMAHRAFAELLSNAIEHSGGSRVTVSMRQTPLQLQLLVSDDGRGIFDAIGETYQIDDPAQAMLELAKGKLSTCPDRHSGHGLFFTARLADVIDLHANNLAFQQRDWQGERWQPGRPACRRGSSVYVASGLSGDLGGRRAAGAAVPDRLGQGTRQTFSMLVPPG